MCSLSLAECLRWMKSDAFVFLQTSSLATIVRWLEGFFWREWAIWDFYQIIYCGRCDKPQKHGISSREKRETQGLERRRTATGYSSIASGHCIQIVSGNRRQSILEVDFCPSATLETFKRKLVFALISRQSISRVFFHQLKSSRAAEISFFSCPIVPSQCLEHQSSMHHRQEFRRSETSRRRRRGFRPSPCDSPTDFNRKPNSSHTSLECHN